MAGWERDAKAWRMAAPDRSEIGNPYGPHPRQIIDLFHPNANAAKSIVVFIHGGYWRSLDPSLFSHFSAGANAFGFSVALPGYRLCPDVGIADIVADVRAACLHLHRRFGCPLVVCGWSAGGHLAASLVATDWRSLDPDAPANLARSGLSISGLFDLQPLLKTSINESLRLDAALAETLSPAVWQPPPGATFETWIGERESSEFHRQSRLICERWATAGARTRYMVLPGANHFTAPAPLADPRSALTEALVALCDSAGKP